MNRLCRRLACLATVAGFATVPAWSTNYFVNANLTTGANTGVDWDNAFRPDSTQPTLPDPLQRALAAAQPAGLDNIYVADGTYKPVSPGQTQNRSASFILPLDTIVYGGYAGGEMDLTQRNEFANPTILDGNIGDTGTNTDNSFHVVTCTSADHTTTKLSGFIIQNGYAYDSADPSDTNPKNYGGGILLDGGLFDTGPSLERLKISSNIAHQRGAGVYCALQESYFTNCRFEFNTAEIYGGEGGGVALRDKGYAVFQNCVFFANETKGVGGGISMKSHGQDSIAANCTFNANVAEGVVIGSSTRYGHSVYSGSEGGGSPVIVYVANAISWGNGDSGQLQLDGPNDTLSSYFQVYASNIQAGNWTGNGNINPAQDPRFRDAASGVLTLTGCSPSVDTGLVVWEPAPGDSIDLLQPDNTDLNEDSNRDENTPWDFKNFERLVIYRGDPDDDPNGFLDMGATEECPGDYNGNGSVDIQDLSDFLGNFGSTGCFTGGCARANFVCDTNADINLSDLAFLLSHFGTVCEPGVHGFAPGSGSVTTAVTAYDTGGYSGGGFYGESNTFVFDVIVTIGTGADDWIGSGALATAANGATFRLVPNAGNPPTPGSSVPAKYATFFSQPYGVDANNRFNNPLSNGAIAGKYTGGTGSFTYTSTSINTAWYDSNTTSNDGPAAVFRLVIDVSGVTGRDTSTGLGSVYFTTGSPGAGDIKVADITIDIDHKYADSGSTVTTGAFYVFNQ